MSGSVSHALDRRRGIRDRAAGKMVIGEPWWHARPVVLIGGGQSLRGFDFESMRKLNVWLVGVNQAMFDAPCHAGVSADRNFVRANLTALGLLIASGTQLFLATDEHVQGATRLTRRITGGLSSDPAVVHTAGCSGAAAFNIATLKRGKNIVLMGYDYGGDHYHDVYPRQPPHDGWSAWATHFATTLPQLAAFGVTVIDASPHGALRCFPKASCLDAALESIHGTPKLAV